MLSALLLILATSLDGFSAGVTYGFRQIRLPFRASLAVGGLSLLVLGGAILCARLTGYYIPGREARILGGTLLIALGLWSILEGLCRSGPARARTWIWRCRLPRLGLVVQILSEPVQADLDASGSINGLEALWLGLALSIDAFGIGFCASLGDGFPLRLPVAVAVFNCLFLNAGMALGRILRREKLPFLAVVPGLLLVGLGILRVL